MDCLRALIASVHANVNRIKLNQSLSCRIVGFVKLVDEEQLNYGTLGKIPQPTPLQFDC